LRKSEVAEAFGVSVDFVDQHIWPELRLIRLGRLTLAPISDVERWLEANAARVLDR
jgi:hypothetical protein